MTKIWYGFNSYKKKQLNSEAMNDEAARKEKGKRKKPMLIIWWRACRNWKDFAEATASPIHPISSSSLSSPFQTENLAKFSKVKSVRLCVEMLTVGTISDWLNRTRICSTSAPTWHLVCQIFNWFFFLLFLEK